MKLWESYSNLAISICEKSKLVELSSAGTTLVFFLNGNGYGCLMASTLQFKLFAISSWAIANLYHMNRNTGLS